GSPCLRRWRIPSAQLSRRDRFSVHPAKCPSLLFLSGRSFHRLPLARRDSLVLFRRSFWDRRRHARPDNPCHVAFSLHLLLPFPSPSCRRQSRLLFLRDLWPLAL